MKHIKNKVKVILITTVGIVIFSFIVLSSFIGFQVFSNSTQLVSNADTKGPTDALWKVYNIDYHIFSNTYKVEKVTINSFFQEHKIPADYIYSSASQNSKDQPTVILVYGLGGNRYSNYPLAQFFMEKGFNVITYDQRPSNENTAKFTTFVYWEKHDLIDWINYVKIHAPGQITGIFGASLGGATAGLALGYEDIDKKGFSGFRQSCRQYEIDDRVGNEERGY